MAAGQSGGSASRRTPTQTLELLVEHLRADIPDVKNRLHSIEGRLDTVENPERSWKNPNVLTPLIVAVISGLLSILAILIAQPDPPPPRGEILSPQNGQQLDLKYKVTGTLANIPDGHHVWLLVRMDNVFYARKPEIKPGDQAWTVTIAEDGMEDLLPDQKFTLVLLMVESDGQQQIESSLQGDRSPTKLENVSGSAQLDAVEDLSLNPPPDILTHPVRAIFPQADGDSDGMEEGHPFEFSDPKTSKDFQSTFTADPNCSREGRPIGLRIDYDMRPKGSYGGWGILWAESEPFDASNYSRLILWVKSISGSANFEVGLKDSAGDERKAQTKALTVVEQQWQPLEVPIADFSDEDARGIWVDLSDVVNMNLGFNETHGQGHICIDQIEFQ